MIDRRQRQIGFLVAGCTFMELLDGTIVTTAAPRIGAALRVPATSISLVVAAYLITLAVLIPLSGWAVSRVGTRTLFLAAIAVFTLASVFCSTSTNLGELVAWRILQGTGGAMMVPVGRLAVLASAAKSDLMRLISYIVWPALMAPVIAPLAGGFITEYASWRWLFLINVPLGALAFVAAFRLIPSVQSPSPRRLDWVGVVLTCLGLGGATFVTSLLSEPKPPWVTVIATGLLAGGLLAAALWHLLRVPEPLIDLRTFLLPTFRTAVGFGSLTMMAIGAVPFLLPLMFESVFGWSPVKSGAVVLWVFVGNIGIKPATSYLINRFGFRTVLIAGGAFLIASIVGMATFTRQTPIAVIIMIAVVSGAARSICGTSNNTLTYCDVPESAMPHANSLAATMQQLSLGLGVTASTLALRMGDPISRWLFGVTSAQEQYAIAFALIAVLPLLAGFGVLRLDRDAGNAARTPDTRKTLVPKNLRACGRGPAQYTPSCSPSWPASTVPCQQYCGSSPPPRHPARPVVKDMIARKLDNAEDRFTVILN